jgi:hypothetical protein
MTEAFYAKEISFLELKRGDFVSKKIQNGKSLEMNIDAFGSQSQVYL